MPKDQIKLNPFKGQNKISEEFPQSRILNNMIKKKDKKWRPSSKGK